MKLNENIEPEKYGLLNLFLETVFYTILLGGTIILVVMSIYFNINHTQESNQEEIITSSVILDIYRYVGEDNINKYFIDTDTGSNGIYSIEISKGDFISYKKGDIIRIKIKNNKAYLLKYINY